MYGWLTPVLLIFPYLLPLFFLRKLPAEAKNIVLGNLALWFAGSALMYISAAVSYIIAFGDNIPFLLNVIFFVLCLLVESIIICIILSRSTRLPRETKANFFLPHWRLNVSPFFVLAFLFFFLYVFYTDGDAIFSPHAAYQLKRDGIGWIWAGMIVFTTMAFVAHAAAKQKFSAKLFLLVIFVMWCSGSKQMLIGFIILIIKHPRRNGFVLFNYR